MSEILLPPVKDKRWQENIQSVADLTQRIDQWRKRRMENEGRSLSRMWFRGNSKAFPNPLRPKVSRDAFTTRAQSLYPDADDPGPILEHQLLKEFRMSGAQHFDDNDVAAVYFTAQHFGMPTRLLDWTMNPLIALFFSAKDDPDKDGELFIMDALDVLPNTIDMPTEEATNVPTDILTMRDGHVVQSIERSFWVCPAPSPKLIGGVGGTFTASGGILRYEYPKGLILPVRPDVRPGRIGQQSSCFTLHDTGSDDVVNPTLSKFLVEAGRKQDTLTQLRRLNVNEYTIYNDLDSLSRAILQSWDVPMD